MTTSSMSEADALLRLALIPGLGSITIQRMLERVSHPAEIFSWSMDRLQSIDGVGGERARRICDPRSEEHLAAERAVCHQAGVRIVTRLDAEYPKQFERLSDPPVVLWIRGDLQPRDQLSISVVGPRRPSSYGHRQAQRLSTSVARVGATIVSGLARGIDTIAHEAAIECGGRTIAILGSGFGRLYPEENRPLAERIANGNGAVISEFPFNAPPSPGTFPRRNRLVAAWSLATLVIEAGGRSGALITARLAGELGREVLVVPGPIDNPACTGSNKLIRDGATLIMGLDDILEEVEPLMTLADRASGATSTESPRAAALSGREKQIYQLLSDDAKTIDELVRVGDVPPSAVAATLLSLELKRLVRKLPEGYVRAT